MKYLTTSFFVILLNLIMYQYSSAQQRNIIWAHGLGDDFDTWMEYDAAFTDISNGFRPDRYERNQPGIPAAANRLIAQVNAANLPIVNDNSGRNGNIFVGHSLGGIVGREIAQRPMQTTMGGLITVGSPNHGAWIVNSLESGRLQEAINYGCQQMTIGPLTAAFTASISGNPYSKIVSIAGSNRVSDILCEFGTNLFFNQFIGAVNPVEEDLAEQSNVIRGLNNDATPVPTINIVGIEQSPVHWRLASSWATDNEDDDIVGQIADITRTAYDINYKANIASSIVSIIGGALSGPAGWVTIGVKVHKGLQWKKGRDWIDDSESIWLSLIGCNRSVVVSQVVVSSATSCAGANSNDPWAVIACFDNPNQIYTATNYTSHVEYVTTYVNSASDGLLSTYTQTMGEVPDGNIYNARGVNHREETNTTFRETQFGNDEMRDRFNDIFRGDRPQNDYFRLQ